MIKRFIKEIREDGSLSAQLVHHRTLPGKDAEYSGLARPLSPALSRLLGERQLYSHQAQALDYIRSGKSVIVATPTASGKSLIYNLPVHEMFLNDPEATALYLYPLKALAQDQLAAFQRLGQAWPEAARPAAALYDGDASDSQRKRIRSSPPPVLMTNPEMLHLSLLPHHASWSAYLANLSLIVVDEAHSYRGLYGSHMAQVFRRLGRVASRYGARPSWIFCTATLGNPRELAGALSGLDDPPVLIDKSGAPLGPKHFMFFDPVQSAASCAIDLLKRALKCGLRTIVYCQSRKMTELVSMWTASSAGEWSDRISSYRAGYLPEERREIEAKMASGELLAVVSTSALELGIDIGSLDVCILVGYPGTIMQTMQRGGRVGRACQESALLMVADEDALDHYFINNPEEFFSRPLEKAIVNPLNQHVLAQHLECAAAEFPLEEGETILQSDEAQNALARLLEEGKMARSPAGGEWFACGRQAHRNIDLRGSGYAFSIEDANGSLIGTIDAHRAYRDTHPGAVYIHHGQSYLVEKLDAGSMKVLVAKSVAKWHTRIRAVKSTEIIREYGRFAAGRCGLFYGRLRITDQVRAYEKRANSGNRLVSVHPLDLPPFIFETDGIWFVIPDSIRRKLEESFVHFMGSIHALEHALIGLMPLEVMADRNDFGGISMPLNQQLGLPAVFVYDAMPGGAGLTHAVCGKGLNLLENVRKTVRQCACDEGCPSCIHSPKCGAGNRPLSKSGLLDLLDELLGEGADGQELVNSLVMAEASPADDVLKKAKKPAFPEKSVKAAIKTCVPVKKEQIAFSDGKEKGLEEGRRLEPLAKAEGQLAPPANYVVFDIETRRGAREVGGWQNASRMGISVAVLYDSKDDRFYAYGEDNINEMLERMRRSSLVIGFNNIRFDNEVLSPFAEKLALPDGDPYNLNKLPNLDLLDKIRQKNGLRISLDNLAHATLGTPKSANGLLALRWWQQGEIARIEDYCRKDVELTRGIYLYGLREKCLFYTNKAGKKTRISVDFS